MPLLLLLIKIIMLCQMQTKGRIKGFLVDQMQGVKEKNQRWKSKDFLGRTNVQFSNWTALKNSGICFRPQSLRFLFYDHKPPITLDSNFAFRHHPNQTLFLLKTRNVNYSFSFSQGCHRTLTTHCVVMAVESWSLQPSSIWIHSELWGLSHLMNLNGYQRLSDIQKVKKKLNIYFPSILSSWAWTCDLGFSLQIQPHKKNIAWRVSTQMWGTSNISFS